MIAAPASSFTTWLVAVFLLGFETRELEGPRYDRVPARVSESGDFLVRFGELIGRVAFDAHPERAPAEAPERIRNWNRSLPKRPWPCGSRCRPFAADGGASPISTRGCKWAPPSAPRTC